MKNIDINDNMLKILEKLAKKAYKKKEIPVGAIIIDSEGNIVSKAYNTRQSDHNVLGHAEVNAILKAEKKLKDWRLDGYYMIVTLEPCDMCSAIINECRLSNVFYLVKRNSNRNYPLINDIYLESSKYNDYRQCFSDLLTSFFNNMR